MATNVKRRALLKTIAAGLLGAAAGAMPLVAGARNGDTSPSDPLSRALLTLLPDHVPARAAGRRYLAGDATGSSGAVERCRALLAPYYGEPLLLAAALRRRRAFDFAHRDSVVLDGWVLARCEADLCAALTLLTDA